MYLPEQTVGWFLLGFEPAVEDELTELSSVYILFTAVCDQKLCLFFLRALGQLFIHELAL